MKVYKILKTRDLEFSNLRDIRTGVVEQIKDNVKESGYNDARVLVVLPQNEGKYVVAGGNHRLQALLDLDIKDVPCLIVEDGDLYQLAIQDNVAENTYAPIDLFDYLDMIGKLKEEGLTQEEIGAKIGWSREGIKNHYKILDVIGTEVLGFCKLHQKERVPKKGTIVPFNFTEGWFRNGGLYGLNADYQLSFLNDFMGRIKKERKPWTSETVKQKTGKYKQWQEFIETCKDKLVDQSNLSSLIELIENDTFRNDAQLLRKIGDFNKESKNKLICGDCVSELEKLDDSSIDLVITDPPYGQEYSCWKDSDLDFVGREGVINDDESIFGVLEETCKILKQKTKPDSHLYFFCSWKVEPQFREIIGKYFEIKNRITWYKGNDGAGDLVYNWGDSTEDIIYAFKGKRPINKGNRKMNHLDISRLDHTRKIHPTQKPTGLIRELLKVSAQPNDVICDPFMGSGAIIKACKEAGNLNYIGIEIDKKVFERARSNIGGLT